MAAVGGVAILSALIFVKRNESRLMEEARQKMERSPA